MRREGKKHKGLPLPSKIRPFKDFFENDEVTLNDSNLDPRDGSYAWREQITRSFLISRFETGRPEARSLYGGLSLLIKNFLQDTLFKGCANINKQKNHPEVPICFLKNLLSSFTF